MRCSQLNVYLYEREDNCSEHPRQKATKQYWLEWDCHVNNVSESTAGRKEERESCLGIDDSACSPLCWRSQTGSSERKTNQEGLEERDKCVYVHFSQQLKQFITPGVDVFLWVCPSASICVYVRIVFVLCKRRLMCSRTASARRCAWAAITASHLLSPHQRLKVKRSKPAFHHRSASLVDAELSQWSSWKMCQHIYIIFSICGILWILYIIISLKCISTGEWAFYPGWWTSQAASSQEVKGQSWWLVNRKRVWLWCITDSSQQQRETL